MQNMKGADVGEMVQEDPDLLFDDDVEESVAAMRVMWPDLDADALRCGHLVTQKWI